MARTIKRIRRDKPKRVKRNSFEDRIAPVVDGPSVVCSGYGPRLLGRHLVGTVVAMDDAWAVVEFPDKGDGKWRETYSVATGVRKGDSKSRGWKLSVGDLKAPVSKPAETQDAHTNDTVQLLQRDVHPYADEKQSLVFEVWKHAKTGIYFQAFREILPDTDTGKVKRRPCAIPFSVMAKAVSTFGGPDD